jgi:hypothetical protein
VYRDEKVKELFNDIGVPFIPTTASMLREFVKG